MQYIQLLNILLSFYHSVRLNLKLYTLSDYAMDTNMKVADKSFWQEIVLMSLDQVLIINPNYV